VWFVDDLLTQLETHLGLEVGGIGLEVLIEETEALSRVEEIAASSPRLEALILGVGDLSASQGIRLGHIGASADGEFGYPGDVWHYARNRMIGAARANGLDAIDGPFGAISNPGGYEREATWAATLGSVGKWAIHPSQIAIANQVFSPTPGEVERAAAAVRAVEEAKENGLGAASFQGMMIDAATARIFDAVLDRARQCGVA
jgi:citrate lyase subunit beta/citryl-CoA lyase